MHISDGVLTAQIYTAGGVAAAALTAFALKKIKTEDIPIISVMTAAFFVASLIHVKLGPISEHLMLNGLIGIVLGISSFPAIAVALLFQAIMFQHGGITSLGINSLSMGLPALASYAIFKLGHRIKQGNKQVTFILALISGTVSVVLSAVLVSFLLITAGTEFNKTAELVLAANIPISIIEGLITAFTVMFLKKVKPEVIGN
jgi:cobalt/nickel transport system permease protein